VIKNNSQEPDAVEVAEFCRKNDLKVRFIKEMDLETGSFSIVEGGFGGDCAHCNRLRLTSDGKIKPCLFSDLGYSVRELGAEKAIGLALQNKPKSGHSNHTSKFYNIGG
jgi:cyclic pyranopterin phosphate synthase